MSFQTELQSLISQVDGAVACSVMGFDGIAVETQQAPSAPTASAELELDSAWIEYANMLSHLKNAAETLKVGSVQEVSVNSEKVLTVMRLISPEYFVALALKPEGNYGKARYLLRLAAPKLKSEL